MSSLVPNAPVRINNVTVAGDKTAIADLEVLTIGSCSFRFEYMKNVSPLQENNGSIVTPSKVSVVPVFWSGESFLTFSKALSKSPKTPKQAGKENGKSPLSVSRSKTTPKTTPKSSSKSTPRRKSSGPNSKSPLSTPISLVRTGNLVYAVSLILFSFPLESISPCHASLLKCQTGEGTNTHSSSPA